MQMVMATKRPFLISWTDLMYALQAATPGCTKEACSFRDSYSDFTTLAKVYGISSDNVDANSSFATVR